MCAVSGRGETYLTGTNILWLYIFVILSNTVQYAYYLHVLDIVSNKCIDHIHLKNVHLTDI